MRNSLKKKIKIDWWLWWLHGVLQSAGKMKPWGFSKALCQSLSYFVMVKEVLDGSASESPPPPSQPTCAVREPFGSGVGPTAFQELCKDDKADFVCYSGDGHFVCSQCEVIMLGFMFYDVLCLLKLILIRFRNCTSSQQPAWCVQIPTAALAELDHSDAKLTSRRTMKESSRKMSCSMLQHSCLQSLLTWFGSMKDSVWCLKNKRPHTQYSVPCWVCCIPTVALASCNIRLPGCKFDEVNRWRGSKSSGILWKFEIGNVLTDFGSFPCSHAIFTFSFLSLVKIEMFYITGTWMYLVSTRWNMDNTDNNMFHNVSQNNSW